MASVCLTALLGLVVMKSVGVADGDGSDVSTLCTMALRIDCADDYIQQTDETLCATDHRTYRNLCFFSQGKCQESHLDIAHLGPCVTTTTSTTTPPPTSSTATTRPPRQRPTSTTETVRSPTTSPSSGPTVTLETTTPKFTTTPTTASSSETTTVDGIEILRRVFCAPESQVNCDLFAREAYCGSNYVLYKNECEFAKAQCTEEIRREDESYCKHPPPTRARTLQTHAPIRHTRPTHTPSSRGRSTHTPNTRSRYGT